MKAFFAFLAALLITAGVWAQSPMKMSYQAVIRNTSDQLVTNQMIGLRVSILQGSANGKVVYTESQIAVSNSIGLISIEIGGGAGFEAINWANGPYFIKTETDPEGGTSYTITNTSQLLSVPYALHAKTAEAFSYGITETDPVFVTSPAKTILGSDIVEWNNKQDKLTSGKNIVITGDTISATGMPPEGTAPGEMLYWNGCAWVVVPPGTHGKILYFCNGVPTWGGCPSLLSTAAVYGITPTTATSGGYVTNDGGSPVTARGICWGTSANPIITGNHTQDGSDTGAFVSSLTNLLPNTTYYIRTYATNSAGTAYGNEVSFTTSMLTESSPCYSAPDGVIACWSYKDFIIPEGYKVDSVFMNASMPGYPQDAYDLLIGYCAGKTPYDHNRAKYPLDFAAITTPMYKTWLDLSINNIKAPGIVRVSLPTCYGAVWNSLCFAISPIKQPPICFTTPDGVNDYKWSYKDFIIPEGYKIDSVYMDASRPGYSEDKYDFLFAYCPGTTTYKSTAVRFLFDYESITTSMYNTWLDLTKMSVKATGMLRAKLPTHERAIWNKLCIAISELSDSVWSCGKSITVNHIAGTVAPVTKTVTYSTVTNVPGEPTKCWITRNLGADHQATSINDATEASAGWYWQFNQKQGFKHNGETRTPNGFWIFDIEENTNWISVNDPCVLEFGGGWRLPSSSELTSLDINGNWTNWNGPWNSALKLHSAGGIGNNGWLFSRGSYGYYWSNSQSSGNGGWCLHFSSDHSDAGYSHMGYAYPLRCIKDLSTQLSIPTVVTTDISNIALFSSSVRGEATSDGGAMIERRGVCWSTSANPTTNDHCYSTGNGTGEFICNLNGLNTGTLYYVRAFASNIMGTAYGNELSFTTKYYGYSLGQNYGGGIIFYIDSTGQHGLIAAPFDQSTGAEWGCLGALIGNTKLNIGAGQANTMAIINGCSQAGTAARICYDLELNGYNDWFLPSLIELFLLADQNNVGGLDPFDEYWTSTETSSENAYGFYTGYLDEDRFSTKEMHLRVRAIRAF